VSAKMGSVPICFRLMCSPVAISMRAWC
jgi:hypothetical protein